MSQLDEKIAHYSQVNGELSLGLSEEEIVQSTKDLGPSIYNKDSEMVSCTDNDELIRVRENFLRKKLGRSETDESLDRSIKDVCQKMGVSNKTKYRALFYALLKRALA